MGQSRLFWTIVLALLGCDTPPGSARPGPTSQTVRAAELIPIAPEPALLPGPVEVEVSTESAAQAAFAHPRARSESIRRERPRAGRRPITAAWITGGPSAARGPAGKPAPPPVVEETPIHAPILRGGPRWNGQRLGVGRVRLR
jgi:hypothetical protein